MNPNLRYGMYMCCTYVIFYIYISDFSSAMKKWFSREIHPIKYGHIPSKTM